MLTPELWPAWLYIILVLLAILIAALWEFVPFAAFSATSKLRDIYRELVHWRNDVPGPPQTPQE